MVEERESERPDGKREPTPPPRDPNWAWAPGLLEYCGCPGEKPGDEVL